MELCFATQSLCKSYRHSQVLRGLTMQVPQGAIYGLVGQNGAGKTTLIRLLCGLQRPTAGGYTLYGIPHTDQAIVRARRRMGAVVESPALYLDLTARDNLRLQHRMLGLPEEKEIPALLDLVGLGETGKRSSVISLWGCASAWGSPWPCAAARTFWCWTNPSTAWTPRGSLKCGS